MDMCCSVYESNLKFPVLNEMEVYFGQVNFAGSDRI